MVVVPTLLTTVRDVDAQVERLEVHYLANPDGHVHFALLSDWTDAAAQSMPERRRIARGRARGHRAPQRAAWQDARWRHSDFWCFTASGDGMPPKRCWMGWERKRGKLHELNRLLRGATDTSFTAPDGAAVTAPVGCPVRHLARRGHPASDRRGVPPGRDHGASAQSRAARRSAGTGRRGVRCAAAANHAAAARRLQLALSAGVLRVRPASIPMRRPFPTCTRISLARVRTPARGSTTSTRSSPPWPIAFRTARC